MRLTALIVGLAGVVLTALLAGCSAAKYRASADKEAYAAIAHAGRQVTNMEPHFTIESTNAVSLAGFPTVETAEEFLGDYAEAEKRAAVLSLERALELATRHSRSYQSRKEQLYLSALSLTLARHRFAPLFSSSGGAAYRVETAQVEQVVPNPLDPTTTTNVLSDSVVEQSSIAGGASVRVDWLLRDVGRISAAFTTDFLRFISGDPRVVTTSQLSATFARPLLRNAGFKQEVEVLTQAERNLLYALREFVRFRKGFSVQIASTYYAVLGNRDAVRNSYFNLNKSRRTAEQGRALAREGRVPQSDLGRLEQQELSAESTWVNAVRQYRQSLDSFKIDLGLPTDAQLVLDDRELTTLGIRHPTIAVEDATRVALAARLDYQNTRDQVDDAVRQVRLAAEWFKPQADLVASASIRSEPGSSIGIPMPEPARYNWSAGLDVDLPLDRKAERNNYRAALIAEAQARRDLVQLEDEIQLAVRDGWRALEQARRTYEISELEVKLAERRVEMQTLLAELGRARAQDQVDTQNDLVDSLNRRTQALVGHTIARLRFWDNLGILFIKENGTWVELNPDGGSAMSTPVSTLSP